MASRQQQSVEHQSFLMETPSRSLIPMGMATLLPDAAQRIRYLEEILFKGFAQWGYREIIPPTFEYLDVLSKGLPSEILEKCYKFADWTTGRILVLRPDVTAQIARIVSMGMAGQGIPLRLCYRTTVFRYEPEHVGREREVFQLGVELIGADNASMDAEILMLLIESLKALGLLNFKISIGHVGFYQSLLAKSGMSEEGRRHAELAAVHKDLPKLERILKSERVSKKMARVILETPGRFGREEVLKWGRTVASGDQRLTKPIDRLDQVYRLLETAGFKDHLLLDLGEFRGFDYYDGLVFDVFSGKIGCELGGGGRYNHLIRRFGRDLPSTGFALDIDRLFGALDRTSDWKVLSTLPVLIIASVHRHGVAFKVAQRLRSDGITVLQETVSSLKPTYIRAVLRRARELCMGFLVVIGQPPLKANEALLFPIVSQRGLRGKRKILIQDLPMFLKKANYEKI